MFGTKISFISSPNGFVFRVESFSKDLVHFAIEKFNAVCDIVENETLKEFPSHVKSWDYPAWNVKTMVDWHSHLPPSDAIPLWENADGDVYSTLVEKHLCVDCPPMFFAQTYVPFNSKELKFVSNQMQKKFKEKINSKEYKKQFPRKDFTNSFEMVVL